MEAFTIAEAAKYLGLSNLSAFKQRVRWLVTRGQLKPISVERPKKFAKTDIEALRETASKVQVRRKSIPATNNVVMINRTIPERDTVDINQAMKAAVNAIMNLVEMGAVHRNNAGQAIGWLFPPKDET